MRCGRRRRSGVLGQFPLYGGVAALSCRSDHARDEAIGSVSRSLGRGPQVDDLGRSGRGATGREHGGQDAGTVRERVHGRAVPGALDAPVRGSLITQSVSEAGIQDRGYSVCASAPPHRRLMPRCACRLQDQMRIGGV